MIWRALLLVILCWCSSVTAQTSSTAPATEPILRMDLETDTAIPGQQISLRVTVLVPTFMPAPPEWPSFELPNLLVRLPERSTNPTSERIGGSTWSGISRHYRLSPMIPGQFTLPPQDILITYADPESNEPIRTTLKTGQVTFSGTIPEGAEGLDPFIAASDLNLNLDIEGDTKNLSPGQSVKLALVAQIKGTSPMFLPRLMPVLNIEGIAAYPDEPSITEASDRGEVSGTRRESVTLVAEGGGSGQVPEIAIDWYNLDSKKIETATTESVELSVTGPPAASNSEPRDWRAIAIAAVAILLTVTALTLVARRVFAYLKGQYREYRQARLVSEPYAFRKVRDAVRQRDYQALHTALETWRTRLPVSSDPLAEPEIQNALTDLGRSRYGETPGNNQDEIAAWHALAKALPKHRRSAETETTRHMLPPLNPGA